MPNAALFMIFKNTISWLRLSRALYMLIKSVCNMKVRWYHMNPCKNESNSHSYYIYRNGTGGIAIDKTHETPRRISMFLVLRAIAYHDECWVLVLLLSRFIFVWIQFWIGMHAAHNTLTLTFLHSSIQELQTHLLDLLCQECHRFSRDRLLPFHLMISMQLQSLYCQKTKIMYKI